MPYKKTKKQAKRTTKRKVTEDVKRKKAMAARLIVISLKVDDYVYKDKPISTREAEMYAREMESFRSQCRDERYLQVIEKLTSYMNCLIKEQSPINIVDTNIIDLTEPIEELPTVNDAAADAGPVCNVIDIEMERSISKLSIVDPKHTLVDSNVKNIYQKTSNIENSTSKVTKEILSELKNNILVSKDAENNILKLVIGNIKPISQKQQETADDRCEESDENYRSLNALQKDTDIKNKQTQILDDTKNTSEIVNPRINNPNNKSELSDQNTNKENKKKIVDDISDLSQNLLSNFEYRKYPVSGLQYNTINCPPHHGDIPYNIADTKNKVTDNTNSEISNLNAIKENEINGNSSKLPQNMLSNLQYENYTIVNVLQNNTNSKNNQLRYIDDTRKNIANTISNKVTNAINKKMETNYSKLADASNPTATPRKEIDENCNKLSQNLLSNFEYGNYADIVKVRYPKGILKNNTNPTNDQTQQNVERHCTIIHNTTSKTNQSQQGILTPNLNSRNISLNQSNKTKKVRKRRNTVKNGIAKTAKRRSYGVKNKLKNVNTAQCDLNNGAIINPTVQGSINPENSVSSSVQKKRRLKKKYERTDLSWLENIKFVRKIETEEFAKMDNFPSFWKDLSLPSDITLGDFEYDNINIWKR